MEDKNIYIGHRYVPKIMGVWDKSKEYEGLSIVQWEGNSFTSSKQVPAGIELSDEDYWFSTGNYNAQIEHYREDVSEVKKDITNLKTDTEISLGTKLTKEEFLSFKVENLQSLNEKTENLIVSKTYLIGAAGDFETINEALENLSKKQLTYKKNGLKIELRLKSGFIVKEQILLSEIDLGWFIITSEDPIVEIDRRSLTTIFGHENKYPVFGGKEGATLPIIGALFKMNTTGIEDTSRDGVYLENASHVLVESGCGITHASGYGLRAWDNCTISARSANFSHSNERNCMISQGTRMSAPYINLSYAKGRNGFRAFRGVQANLEGANISHCAEVAVRISEASMVDIQNADLSYSGTINSENDGGALGIFGTSNVYASGINATYSKGTAVTCSSSSSVVIDGADLSYAEGRGIDVFSNARAMALGIKALQCKGIAIRASSLGTIDCNHADVSNGFVGVQAQYGGIVYAGGTIANNNEEGFVAHRGGKIIANDSYADNCDTGFNAYWEGEISARGCSAINAAIAAVSVSTGSEFKGSTGTFTGAQQYGCYVYRNSKASIYDSNFRKGTIDDSNDVVCLSGSIIQASNVTGGKNTEVNTISGKGIIFG